jgi:hypothetical protein
MWFFVDEPWQYRVLDALPPGIDQAQLDRARRLTPAERIDAVMALMETAEELQRAMAKKRTEG